MAATGCFASGSALVIAPPGALPRVLGVVWLVVAVVFGAVAILSAGVLALPDEDAQAGDSEYR